MINVATHSRINSKGFTIVELMTVLVIIMLLAMIGFPTYQEYQNRANIAEAETMLGAMDRKLRAYFLDHGSFYSASPQPATVPGLVSLGEPSAFVPSGGWNVIGTPISNGSEVNFSYQVFAGQTAPGTTTPTVNDYLYNPTDDMNLIRRTSTAQNNIFKNAVKVAVKDELLRLDWSDFNLCARASDYDDCKLDCGAKYKGDSKGESECIAKSCADKQGAPPTNCKDDCANLPEGDKATCEKNCDGESDGKCGDPKNPYGDSDCYADTNDAEGSCYTACIGFGKRPDDCKIACEKSDGKCGNPDYPYGDQDCYGDSDSECMDICLSELGESRDSREQCGIKCGNEAEDSRCATRCEALVRGVDHDRCMELCEEGSNECPHGAALNGNCLPAGGGGGGGGPPPDDGDGETDDGEYSGGGGDDDGDGESDEGEESGDDNGSIDEANGECAAFGIARPIDFGILQNQPNYNWMVLTAVGNFRAGAECTMLGMAVQGVDGKFQATGIIKVNTGE